MGTGRNRRQSNAALIAVMLAGACTFLNVYTTQPLLPLLRQLFHASEIAVSLTVSATMLAIALAAPLAGVLAERFGRKRVILPSILLLTLPTVLAATSPNLHWLIAWRFMQGLFVPGIAAVMIAYIGEEWAGRGVGSAMAYYISGTVLGGFLGRFLTGLIADHFSWRLGFVAIGLINFAGAIGVWRWLPSSANFVPSSDALHSIREGWAHLRNLRLVAVFGMGFLLLVSHVGVFTYVNFYLAGAPFQLDSAELGSIFFVYLFGLVVTPLSGKLLDRSGFRPTLLLALAMGVAGLLLSLTHSLALVICGLALFSSGVFVSQAVATVQIGRVAGAGRSTAAGMYITAYYGGGCFGAIVPAWAWMRGGWPACVAFLMVTCISTATLGFISSIGHAKERVLLDSAAEIPAD